MNVTVECYAGHRGEQTPARVSFDGRAVALVELLDCWLAPEHRYFKMRGQDGSIYLLRHDTLRERWELILYDAPKPGETLR